MIKPLMLGIAVSATAYAVSFAGSLPTIVIDSRQVVPSAATQTVSLDVWVDGNGATPIELAGFQLKLSVVGADDLVQFLGLGAPVAHPYLFEPTSAMPIGQIASDGLSVELDDFLDTGTALLADGDGLAGLTLEVQPGAMESYQVEVSLDPTESFLAQSLTEFVPFNVLNGSVRIVPEPITLWLAVLGLAVGGRLRLHRRVPKGAQA